VKRAVGMTDKGQADWSILRKPKAVEDLLEIWLFLAEHDENLADRWIDRLDEGVARLAEFPRSGARRGNLADDLRVWPILPYLIIYRLDDAAQVVDILRIVDGRRDIGKLLA
jgi:toxin ParE1/3/4